MEFATFNPEQYAPNPHETALVTEALQHLEQQKTIDMRPVSAILTTNEHIIDRQIRLVDASDTDDPHYKAFFKVENWHEIVDNLQDQETVPYDFTTIHGKRVQVVSEVRATEIEVEGVSTYLLQSDSGRAIDQLVEMHLPVSSPHIVTENVSKALNALTGQTLWDETIAEQSLSAWKQAAYKKYLKLPEGPLTEKQAVEASHLEIAPDSNGHISLRTPGRNEYLKVDEAAVLRPRHQIARAGNALDILINGSIDSSLMRLERGSTHKGRSSDADIITGGGDVVYTYATPHSNYEDVTIVFDEAIMDRIDVRAYETDAYGSTETFALSKTDTMHDRSRPFGITASYEDRITPDKIQDLRGVHELCFEGSIGTGDIAKIIIKDTGNSFTDFDWVAQCRPYIPEGYQWGGNLTADLERQIHDAWGDESAVRDILTNIGMPLERAEYLTIGMNQPVGERMKTKLAYKGITQLNGKPIADVIEITT